MFQPEVGCTRLATEFFKRTDSWGYERDHCYISNSITHCEGYIRSDWPWLCANCARRVGLMW